MAKSNLPIEENPVETEAPVADDAAQREQAKIAAEAESSSQPDLPLPVEFSPQEKRIVSLRLMAVVMVLMLIVVGQQCLAWHFSEVEKVPPGGLTSALSALPMEIGPWKGVDRPIEDEKLLYADEHLQRTYVYNGRQVSVWAVFSKVGEDRGHNPEVCMAVAGQPQDPEARKILEVDPEKHKAPIQQYRFGRPGQRQLVFYWFYRLPPEDMSRFDSFQQLYYRLNNRGASVTFEVFAPEQFDDDGEVVRDFVTQLDRALQPLVGPNAKRGSTRLPVTVIEDEQGKPEGEAPPAEE